MSESDSFINEVTEEVQREKLYGYVRRYGWIAVVAVLALVGGTAWNEWRKASAQAQAEATGDALLAALNENDPGDRMAAIAAVQGEGAAAAVTALLTASTQQDVGETAEARATLEALAVNGDVPTIYADLAAFKAAMLQEDATQKAAALEALSQPGAPFRLLALEQQAYLALEAGDTDTALGHMNAVLEDAGVSRNQATRIQGLLIALGETPPANPVLQ